MTGPELHTIRCVGALIYRPDGSLLLVRRANEPGRGRWSVPGGRVEPGEDDPTAVAREVAEETALRVIVGRLAGMVKRQGPTGDYVIYDYVCDLVGGTPAAGSDAADIRWVNGRELAELDRNGALVDQLATTLREWRVAPT